MIIVWVLLFLVSTFQIAFQLLFAPQLHKMIADGSLFIAIPSSAQSAHPPSRPSANADQVEHDDDDDDDQYNYVDKVNYIKSLWLKWSVINFLFM